MNQTSTTDSVLAHHLKSLAAGEVAEVLSDYTEQSILFTQNGPVRGLAALEQFFVSFFASLPSTFMSEFEILRQDLDGEIAYLVWRSGVTLQGTDTFVIRDGKILIQTFAVYVPAVLS